jgi:hypothetical protein
VAPYTGDLAPFGQQLLNREVLAQLGPSRNRPVDQDLVEDTPPRRVALRDAIDVWRSPFQDEWTNVELHAGTGGQFEATTLSSNPHLLSRATPGWWM